MGNPFSTPFKIPCLWLLVCFGVRWWVCKEMFLGPGQPQAVPDIRGGKFRAWGEVRTQSQGVFFCSFWTLHQLTVWCVAFMCS